MRTGEQDWRFRSLSQDPSKQPASTASHPSDWRRIRSFTFGDGEAEMQMADIGNKFVNQVGLDVLLLGAGMSDPLRGERWDNVFKDIPEELGERVSSLRAALDAGFTVGSGLTMRPEEVVSQVRLFSDGFFNQDAAYLLSGMVLAMTCNPVDNSYDLESITPSLGEEVVGRLWPGRGLGDPLLREVSVSQVVTAALKPRPATPRSQ